MAFLKKFSKETLRIVSRGVLSYFLCLAAFYFYDKSTAGGAETRELGLLPYIVISVWFAWIFFHNRILLLKFAFTNKQIRYGIFVATGIVFISFLQQRIVFAGLGVIRPIGNIILSVSFYTLLGALVFLAFEFLKNQRAFYQINTLKKEMELQQLKTQLNPHFLFNALNNIYSYNLENSERGNDLILKLGQLMRFIIEFTHRESIPLQDEIGFVENYLAFEKERLGSRCLIIYENQVSFTDKGIPPLLLFPFIENAFKHGTNSIQPTEISILLNDTKHSLTLTVKNQVTLLPQASTKTGLSNLMRRLELLFPGKHELTIAADSKQYTARLNLSL